MTFNCLLTVCGMAAMFAVANAESNLLCDSQLAWSDESGAWQRDYGACSVQEVDSQTSIFGRSRFDISSISASLISDSSRYPIRYSVTGQISGSTYYSTSAFGIIMVKGSIYNYYPGVEFYSNPCRFSRAYITSNGITTYSYPTSFADGSAIDLSCSAEIKLTVELTAPDAQTYNYYINDRLVGAISFGQYYTSTTTKFGIFANAGTTTVSRAELSSSTDGGCADYATEREVVADAIYACPGTFASGGTLGSAAAALCNNGYHVCRSATEASFLGLTTDLCLNVAQTDQEFFGTQETGPGGWQCESVYGNDEGLTNDIWGCARSSAATSTLINSEAAACLSLTAFLGNGAFHGWDLSAGTVFNEAEAYALTDASSGGVLCCADGLYLEYEHLGCYADTSNRALDTRYSDVSSIGDCGSQCAAFPYFSLQYGAQCFCDDSYADATQYGASTACWGQGFGGTWSHDLYRNPHFATQSDQPSAPSVDVYPRAIVLDWNSTSVGFIAAVLALLLVVNLVMMAYANCCGGKNGRTRYQTVKMVDSDVEPSEAEAINI